MDHGHHHDQRAYTAITTNPATLQKTPQNTRQTNAGDRRPFTSAVVCSRRPLWLAANFRIFLDNQLPPGVFFRRQGILGSRK